MKNHFKETLLFCYFLFLSSLLFAQPNQATIFELNHSNINAVATNVHTHLVNNSIKPITEIPTVSRLVNFFTIAFNNKIYTYEPNTVPPPGIRLFEQGGNLHFNFDNIANLTNNTTIYVGELDYSGTVFPSVSSVFGPAVYNGINFSGGAIQFQIFALGTLSNNCSSSAIHQCYSNLEIIIVDKNIL